MINDYNNFTGETTLIVESEYAIMVTVMIQVKQTCLTVKLNKSGLKSDFSFSVLRYQKSGSSFADNRKPVIMLSEFRFVLKAENPYVIRIQVFIEI